MSKIADTLGYDVTEPQPSGGKGRYEVKTTRGVGSIVEVYLSRNEAQTGLRDPSWSLIVCRVDHQNTFLGDWLVPGR